MSLKEYLHLYQSGTQLLYCSWQSASATPTGNVELNFSGLFFGFGGIFLFFFTELQKSSMFPYHEFLYLPLFPYLGVSLQISSS